MTAEVCQTFVKRKKLRPGLDFAMPILIYEDAIRTTLNRRMSVNPVLVSLGILKHSVRSQQEYTTPAGFVPMFDLRTKAQKQADNIPLSGKGRSLWNFHACHLAITPISIRFGSQIQKVFVHMPCILFYRRRKSDGPDGVPYWRVQ
jgi:hypothetical protein